MPEKKPENAASALLKKFDVDDPVLHPDIEDAALGSGGYPYAKRLKRSRYEEELEALQIELLKLQLHIRSSGRRIVMLFEGRDTAGKGGTIKRFMEHLMPRHAKAIALAKPTEVEREQWYFQRYARHLPTAGDMTLFDRSWYNRAGVERVMGFCTKDQLADFLREAPQFEGMLVRDGIRLFKFFLVVGREMQLKRLHKRRHHPLKHWKLSDMDLAAIHKWDAYSEALHDMFCFTHTPTTPWTVVHANDQRRARLESIRHLLLAEDYAGKDLDVIGQADPLIIGSDAKFVSSFADG